MRFIVCCLLLIVIGFALRLIPLNQYVTPDEPAWVHRSITFSEALHDRDWSAIPVTGHPGVTTMWLGTAAVRIEQLIHPDASSAHLDWIQRLAWLAPENGEAFRHLGFFLPAGRIAVALASSLVLAAIAFAVNQMWGREAALLSLGLLAFAPFLIGHSGLLHTDALLASFCTLAVLAALNGSRSERPFRWYALSGLSTGLALLTKTPGVILIPFVLTMTLACTIYPSQNSPSQPNRIARMAAHLVIFVTCAGMAVLALYPAVWSNPVGVAQSLSGFAGDHLNSVQRPIFFAGEMTYDPGTAFYPLVLLFRSSPVVLIGLIIVTARLSKLPSERRFSFLALNAFAVLFGVMMTMGAKKHDRYLLPTLTSMSAAVSLLFDTLKGSHNRFRQASLALVLLQPCLALLFAVYPLTYFNPLFGGPVVASRILPSGWGETMGLVARSLNRNPKAEQLTVATISPPSFAPIFVGRTVPLNAASLAIADYVVDLAPQSAEAHIERVPILYTYSIGSLQPVDLRTDASHAELARYLESTESADLIIVDADIPLLRNYRGEATIESAEDKPDEQAIADWLREIIPDEGSVWLVSSVGASPITSAQLERQLSSLGTIASERALDYSSVTQYTPTPPFTIADPLSYIAHYGGQLELVDASSFSTVAWPTPLRATLRWRTRALLVPDLRTVVSLRDTTGFEWSRVDRLVLNPVTFPTSAWAPGEWADASYGLPIPAGIPPGDYSIEVGLYNPATGAGRGASGTDSRFLGTQVRAANVSILPPPAPPTVEDLQIPVQLDSPTGQLELLGLAPPPEQVLSGDFLSLHLFWEVKVWPEADYHAQLTLTDSSGENVFEVIQPLSTYPTSQWEPGQRFKTHHSVHIPPILPAADYRLTLNLVDESGNPAWSTDMPLSSILVLHRERSFEMPSSIPFPLEYEFGEAAHLLGYDLEQAELSPGQSVQLTLYWQAQGPTQKNYTLFVHLLGANNTIRGQVDLTPGAGMAPTTSWAPGQVIVDQISIPIEQNAPPGSYQVVIGFYDPAYGTRLSVTDGSGEVLTGDQAALPVLIDVVGNSE
jgi:4-amino-4-deoxy-L-arabinose transferase-like glycosyltransferase